ncbi:hypothetical protein DMJ13_05625 [halophilic archaeon]|nr:hypothetical protein DMJ13_05625 [halophilic archaeon]
MNARTMVTESGERSSNETGLTTEQKVADVSEMAASEVAAYLRSSDGGEVYFERKGGRTFVVAEE